MVLRLSSVESPWFLASAAVLAALCAAASGSLRGERAAASARDQPVSSGGREAHAAPEFAVNTYASPAQWTPSAAMASDGRFVVVWEGYGPGASYGIHARRYGSNGRPTGPEALVSEPSCRSVGRPSAAMDNEGRFVVAWENAAATGPDIHARRYAADGAPLGPEFVVNRFTAGGQFSASAASAADGRFVVAWMSEGQDGSGFGVYAQAFTADGLALGPQRRVNTFTDGNQQRPAVAMAPGGRFVIVWESEGQDGSGAGVYGQRFADDGAPLGEEFRVNTTTDLSQGEPSAAMDNEGRFIVAWTSQGQDGSGEGVYGRRYDPEGNPASGEFRVNTTTAGNQSRASVRARSNGAFVVAWTGRSQDSGEDVYAQRFDAQGAQQGGEVTVNTRTAGDQALPSVAMTAGGRWVVAWMSRGLDSDPAGIYAQRYSAQGVALGQLPW